MTGSTTRPLRTLTGPKDEISATMTHHDHGTAPQRSNSSPSVEVWSSETLGVYHLIDGEPVSYDTASSEPNRQSFATVIDWTYDNGEDE